MHNIYPGLLLQNSLFFSKYYSPGCLAVQFNIHHPRFIWPKLVSNTNFNIIQENQSYRVTRKDLHIWVNRGTFLVNVHLECVGGSLYFTVVQCALRVLQQMNINSKQCQCTGPLYVTFHFSWCEKDELLDFNLCAHILLNSTTTFLNRNDGAMHRKK